VTIRTADLDPGLTYSDGLHRLGQADDLFCIAGIARYRCRSGSEIVVEAVAGVPERNVRLYLLGSVMGLLLHQRGMLPLHGNAIVIDRGAYVFIGPSGIGKSTLAAWFHDRAYPVLADDVALVRFEGTQALVEPGLSRLRLWRDAVVATGRAADGYPRSYMGDDSWEKFDIPLEVHGLGPMPLRAVVLLGESDKVGWERLTGVQAVDALLANTYRGSYLDGETSLQRNLETCLRLVRSIPVMSWQRPRAWSAMDEQNDDLLACLRHLQEAPEGTSNAPEHSGLLSSSEHASPR
jgi:hypothetical protein